MRCEVYSNNFNFNSFFNHRFPPSAADLQSGVNGLAFVIPGISLQIRLSVQGRGEDESVAEACVSNRYAYRVVGHLYPGLISP